MIYTNLERGQIRQLFLERRWKTFLLCMVPLDQRFGLFVEPFESFVLGIHFSKLIPIVCAISWSWAEPNLILRQNRLPRMLMNRVLVLSRQCRRRRSHLTALLLIQKQTNPPERFLAQLNGHMIYRRELIALQLKHSALNGLTNLPTSFTGHLYSFRRILSYKSHEHPAMQSFFLDCQVLPFFLVDHLNRFPSRHSHLMN